MFKKIDARRGGLDKFYLLLNGKRYIRKDYEEDFVDSFSFPHYIIIICKHSKILTLTSLIF
jgi:hypothetical protein